MSAGQGSTATSAQYLWIKERQGVRRLMQHHDVSTGFLIKRHVTLHKCRSYFADGQWLPFPSQSRLLWRVHPWSLQTNLLSNREWQCADLSASICQLGLSSPAAIFQVVQKSGFEPLETKQDTILNEHSRVTHSDGQSLHLPDKTMTPTISSRAWHYRRPARSNKVNLLPTSDIEMLMVCLDWLTSILIPAWVS